MKKFFIAVVCLMLVVVGAVGVTMSSSVDAVASAESVSKITVNGVGEIKLAPDMAVISLGVETLNESLAAAQKENSEGITNLIDAIKGFGVKEEDIKTKNFYVYQRYDYSQGEKFLGYQVSNYIDFKTKDVDNVSSIVNKLLESGANKFSGISFTIEDYESAYKLALEKALENAKSKASAIADREISTFEVCEESSYSIITRDSYSLSSLNSEASTMMKGEITVRANIRVIFEY